MFRTVLFAAAVIASNTEAKLLATADGIRISPADIDQVVGAAEFRIRNERYQAQRRAVDKLLNEQLLTKEAAARAVSVPDLLSVEIDSHLLQPEQANVQVALTRAEKVYPTVPRDELINRIRAAMLQPQRAELQAAFFRRLREKYHARVLLEPPRLIFEPPGWMQFAGGATAPVTMVMFSDFQCPSCKNFFGTLNSLRDHFNHNLRIAFVNFPLKNHKAARSAALAAICGFRQGAGWRIAEELFKSALTDASDEKIKGAASATGLNMEQFVPCLLDRTSENLLDSQIAFAERLGVSATPTVFVNGRMVVGFVPPWAMIDLIDEELGGSAPSREKVVAGK